MLSNVFHRETAWCLPDASGTKVVHRFVGIAQGIGKNSCEDRTGDECACPIRDIVRPDSGGCRLRGLSLCACPRHRPQPGGTGQGCARHGRQPVAAFAMYPWAVVYREEGLIALLDMGVFLAILFLGLLYGWSQGALRRQE